MSDKGDDQLIGTGTVGSDEAKWDQSVRAEAVLQHILEGDTAPVGTEENGALEEKRMTVEEAIATRPVLEQDTGRTKARVLFVTTDERALIDGSSLRLYYAALSEQFDEVHVFCLVPRKGEDKFDRAGGNLWFYQVRASHWWNLPWTARAAAMEALTWNGAARPDIIVGVDLFEAGLAAYLIAKKFGRPVQFHSTIDPFTSAFKTAAPDNNWRVRIAKFLLRRAKSVRVATGVIKDSIKSRHQKLTDIAVMPKFYDFSGLADAVPSLNLHEKYRDFSFIILAFGELTAKSELHDLFAALNWILKNPRVGLVVVGDGSGKQLFVDKVKLLGIDKNVVFVKEVEDLVSYLKTADLMIEVDTDEESEVRVLKGAMAGAPLLITKTDLRVDLFKDGESAFICDPGDMLCVSQKTTKFVNSAVYRTKFAENAAHVARSRVNEDPTAHYQAIAVSIESALARSA